MAGESLEGKNRHPQGWIRFVPYGLTEQHPSACKRIVDTPWEIKDNLSYTWRTLCDSCGPRLLLDRFLTNDGKGHFLPSELLEGKIPAKTSLLSTQRGQRFNRLIHGEIAPGRTK